MTKASSWCARTLTIAIIGGLLTAATARTASAQTKFSSTIYGVGEYDTDQTFLILGGLVFGPAGLGWHPQFGVQAYNVSFDNGPSRTAVTSVKPFVGLTNRFADGSASLSVGYAFTTKDVSVASSAVGESGDGVVVSGGWQTYGSTTPLAYQLLGSFNFGSNAVWTRGRATGKVSGTGPKTVRLGGELALLNESHFTVWQPGAVVEFHSGSSVWGLGAGMKFFQNSGINGNNVYFKVEGSMPLGGR